MIWPGTSFKPRWDNGPIVRCMRNHQEFSSQKPSISIMDTQVVMSGHWHFSCITRVLWVNDSFGKLLSIMEMINDFPKIIKPIVDLIWILNPSNHLNAIRRSSRYLKRKLCPGSTVSGGQFPRWQCLRAVRWLWRVGPPTSPSSRPWQRLFSLRLKHSKPSAIGEWRVG